MALNNISNSEKIHIIKWDIPKLTKREILQKQRMHLGIMTELVKGSLRKNLRDFTNIDKL